VPCQATEHQLCRPKGKDKVVTCGEFGLMDMTILVVAVFVTKKSQFLPNFDAYSTFEKSFSNYRVWLYASYLNIGALNDSSSLSLGTLPMQLDGVVVNPSTPMPKASINVANLGGTFLHYKEMCTPNHMLSLINRGKLPPNFAEIPLWFHSTPQDLDLARNQRAEPIYITESHFT
jgi:hypothetical protein